MIVHFVRKHTATPGVTVTESRLMPDAVMGITREVDVVVEGTFDGDISVTSIEVIEHKRPADINWVEQQITKHRALPTTRLILVSKVGLQCQRRQARQAGGRLGAGNDPTARRGQAVPVR